MPNQDLVPSTKDIPPSLQNISSKLHQCDIDFHDYRSKITPLNHRDKLSFMEFTKNLNCTDINTTISNFKERFNGLGDFSSIFKHNYFKKCKNINSTFLTKDFIIEKIRSECKSKDTSNSPIIQSKIPTQPNTSPTLPPTKSTTTKTSRFTRPKQDRVTTAPSPKQFKSTPSLPILRSDPSTKRFMDQTSTARSLTRYRVPPQKNINSSTPHSNLMPTPPQERGEGNFSSPGLLMSCFLGIGIIIIFLLLVHKLYRSRKKSYLGYPPGNFDQISKGYHFTLNRTRQELLAWYESIPINTQHLLNSPQEPLVSPDVQESGETSFCSMTR